MKFRIKNREEGKVIVANIRSQSGYISVANVKHVIYGGHIQPALKDQDHGWIAEDIYKKIRTRETKSGWFIYFPEPYIDTDSFYEQEEPEIYLTEQGIMLFDRLEDLLIKLNDVRRKCMVHRASRKKNVIVEEHPCYFHCWATNRVQKKDGTIVDQLLAVCEFQDGHVERINFDHIRFVD